RNENNTMIHRTRLSYTKKEHDNFEYFNLPMSNAQLSTKQAEGDKSFNHTLKIRNLGLYLPARVSPSKNKNNLYNAITPNIKELSAQITYPTQFCELCPKKTACDFF